MKLSPLVFTFIMAFVLYSSAGFAEEPDTAHDHHGGESMSLEAPETGRWETDKYLRQGMEGIRKATDSRLDDFHEGRFDEGDASSLAAAIDRNVSLMIENCDLEPKADATLHALLGNILDGKTRLLKNPQDETAMHKILDALHQYPDYFAHEGWQPPHTPR